MSDLEEENSDIKFTKNLNQALSRLSVDDLVSIITAVGIELKIRTGSSRDDSATINRKISTQMKSWGSWGIDDQEVG